MVMALMAENRPAPPPSAWAPHLGGPPAYSAAKSFRPATPETKGHVHTPAAPKPSASGAPTASQGPAAPQASAQPAAHAAPHPAPCERFPLSELPGANAQGTSPPSQTVPPKEDLPGPPFRRSPPCDTPRADGGAGAEHVDRGVGCADKGGGGKCTEGLGGCFTERYEVGRVLGRGAFGDVMECTDRGSRRAWACKVVDPQRLGSEEEREALVREIQILGLLKGRHHGVVQLRETFPRSWGGHTPAAPGSGAAAGCTGSCTGNSNSGSPCASTSTSSCLSSCSSASKSNGSPGAFFSSPGALVYPGITGGGRGKGKGEGLVRIVMEKCGGGDLYNAIATRGRMPESSAKHVFCQVASTLAFCHSRGVIHRDIKPENILFDSSPDCLFAHPSTLPRLSASGELPRVQAKLADFGLAVLVRPGETTTGLLGSRFYTAPEVLKGMRYGRRVDVWGLGVCLYAMLSGRLPFVGRTGDDEEGLRSAILRGFVAFDRPGWEGVSEAAKDLIKRMLNPEPHRRMQSRELLAHPWCAGHLSPSGALPSPLTVPFTLTIPSPISQPGPLPSPLAVPTPLSIPSPVLKPASVTVRSTGCHSKAEPGHARPDSLALAAADSIPLSAQPSSESALTESESEAEEEGFGWGFRAPTARSKAPKVGKGGKRLNKQCSAGDELGARAHPLWGMFYSLRLGASQSYSTYCQLDCRRA